MDAACLQSRGGVAIELDCVRLRTRDVRQNRCLEPSLSKLLEEGCPEVRVVQRRHAQRNEWFATTALVGREKTLRDPKSKHPKHTTGSLESRQRLPLPL